MDYTAAASNSEILMDLVSKVIPIEDVLGKALEEISSLRHELETAYRECTDLRVFLANVDEELETLRKFRSDVEKTHPNINLDILRAKLNS